MSQRRTYNNSYHTTDITTSSRLDLLIKLYDGAILNCRQAKEAIAGRDLAVRGERLGRAIAIVNEFKSTLDYSADKNLCSELERLYSFAAERLTAANINNSQESIDEALKVLEILRSAWVELREQEVAVSGESRGQGTASAERSLGISV